MLFSDLTARITVRGALRVLPAFMLLNIPLCVRAEGLAAADTLPNQPAPQAGISLATTSPVRNIRFNIPAQPLASALAEFSRQSDLIVVAASELTAGKVSTPVSKTTTPIEVLTELLSGTQLIFSQDGGAIIVKPAADAQPTDPRFVRVAAAADAPATAGSTSAPATSAGTDAKPDAAAQPENKDLEEVVVSSSRIQRSGFTAPTPTTVISQEDIQLRAPTDVVSVLNEIPSFRPSSTSTSRPAFAGSGPTSADLRGLGNRRTLVLVDGERFVPSGANGVTDLNLIPTNMIERTDVVTGGASAAWGSDAVSGVVNFITKKRMEGVQADVSYGESQYSDGKTYHFSLSGGSSFDDGKGHFVIGGEYVNEEAVDGVFSRPWSSEEVGTVVYPASVQRPAGVPSRIVAAPVRTTNLTTFGGVVIGSTAATLEKALYGNTNQEIQFGTGGTIEPYPLGQVFGTSTIGGGNPDTAGLGGIFAPAINRYSIMTNIDFQATDHITAYTQINVADSATLSQNPTRGDSLTTNTTGVPGVAPSQNYILIKNDNAYLPAAMSQLMAQTGVTQFYLGRTSYDLGHGQAKNDNQTTRVVAGLRGDYDKWRWTVSADIGQNTFDQPWSNVTINQNWQESYDAVKNAAGQIVCRVNQVTVTVPACVPFDVFGNGSATNIAAVKGFVEGNMFFESTYRQQTGQATVSSEPFSTWAGPVSVVGGADIRHESVSATSDSISQAGGFNYLNPQPYAGAFRAWELFSETDVPLVADKFLAKSLDLNAAVRRTDYSSSGPVVTYKIGSTWDVDSDVRFRATYSRDIRAPNLLEQYGSTTISSGVVNPFTLVTTPTFPSVAGGNPDLQPEKANSWTTGIVLQPRFLAPLRMSVDYWNVTIDGAIETYSNQIIANNCKTEVQDSGPGFFCNFLVTNGQFNNNLQILSINTIPFNLVRQTASGIDFEASYRVAAPKFIGGNFNIRAFATLTEDLTAYDVTGKLQYAGTVYYVPNGLGGVPRWMATLNTDYTRGPATLSLQTRLVGSATIDPTLIGPGQSGYNPSLSNSVSVNVLPNVVYYSLSATWNLIDSDKRRLQIYGVVDNLMNTFPPWALGTGATNSGQYYDVVGRTFKLGIRASL